MKKMIYLVAIDGSEYSDRAAQKAVNIAKDTGAEIHFLTIPSPFGKKTRDERAQPEIVAKEQEISKEMFDPLREKFGQDGVDLKFEILWGHPAEAIHEYAKDNKAKMMFIGRRGRSKVMGLFIGSVANSLAHTAGIPVVLIP